MDQAREAIDPWAALTLDHVPIEIEPVQGEFPIPDQWVNWWQIRRHPGEPIFVVVGQTPDGGLACGWCTHQPCVHVANVRDMLMEAQDGD